MKEASSLYEEIVGWYNNIVDKAAEAQSKAGSSGGEAVINGVLTQAIIQLRKTVDPSYILDEETKKRISQISSQMSAKGAASFRRSGKGELRRGIIKFIGRVFGVAESPSDFFEKQYLDVKKQKERGGVSRASSASTISDSGSRSGSDSNDLTSYESAPAPKPGSIKARAAAIEGKLRETPDVVGLVKKDREVAAATGVSLGQVWKADAAAKAIAAREELARAGTSLPRAPATTPAKGAVGRSDTKGK